MTEEEIEALRNLASDDRLTFEADEVRGLLAALDSALARLEGAEGDHARDAALSERVMNGQREALRRANLDAAQGRALLGEARSCVVLCDRGECASIVTRIDAHLRAPGGEGEGA